VLIVTKDLKLTCSFINLILLSLIKLFTFNFRCVDTNCNAKVSVSQLSHFAKATKIKNDQLKLKGLAFQVKSTVGGVNLVDN